MWNSTLLLVTLVWASHAPTLQATYSEAIPSPASARHLPCFDGDPPAPARAATCEQMAAALLLRPASRQQGGEAMASAAESAGKGALVGGAIGLGIGLVAALIFGPSCEEGHAGCTAGIIVGSTAAFAIIGAISADGKDGDGKDGDSSKKD